MRDAAPALPFRVYRRLRAVLLYPKYRQYLAQIKIGHPLHGVPTRIVGDASEDPREFFDHYDAFAYWAANIIFAKGRRLSVLDVGSVKMMNAVLSAAHDVTSLVLSDCGDRISKVKYVTHDVASRLPCTDHSFDIFTSMVSLPLIGLGRYGDKLDATCLMNFIAELARVMKQNGELIFSLCLGKNVLNFNNGWFFDMPMIERLFGDWQLIDCLVDNASSPKGGSKVVFERFSKDSALGDRKLGDYRVIFLHFRRRPPPQ